MVQELFHCKISVFQKVPINKLSTIVSTGLQPQSKWAPSPHSRHRKNSPQQFCFTIFFKPPTLLSKSMKSLKNFLIVINILYF